MRLVLLLLAICILGDVAHMTGSGALEAVIYERSAGGIVAHGDRWYALRGQTWGGPVLVVTLCLACIAILTNTWPRAAIVVALLAYAQLGHLFDPGDKGIDRIIRTAFVLFALSPVSGRDRRIPQWPVTVLRVLLVLVYLQAGLAKLFATPQWWSPWGTPELLTILADPMAGRLDPVQWWGWQWLFRIGGGGAVFIELTAPMILTRWRGWWALAAMWIHVGIGLTMHLGMFSLGMLAFYPVLLDVFWTDREPQ